MNIVFDTLSFLVKSLKDENHLLFSFTWPSTAKAVKAKNVCAD